MTAEPARREAVAVRGDLAQHAELEKVGIALVRIEAWCRQRGMDELATLIDVAACHADRLLTRR